MQKTKIKGMLLSIIVTTILFLSIVPASAYGPHEDELVDAVILFRQDVKVTIHNLQLEDVYPALNGIHAKIPRTLYNLLSKAWYVDAIQEDRTVNIQQDTLDWGVDDVDAEQVWGSGEDAKDVVVGNYAGQGVKVCIIDTGIDYTHPDLDGVYQGGYDFVSNDADPKDDNGHGTHCAGIVAAEDNGVGVIGTAPKADIYAVKALDSQGSGTISNIVAGIDWAVSNNMDIISMSLGASSGDASLENAINDAYNAGIVVVAASGNDGQRAISYPARYSNAIAVGAIDSNHQLASFSNYGPEQEVVAPGVNIYSTMPTYSVTLTSWWYGYSENYDTMSGTSMATPMVAGVIALMLSADPSLTPDEVRNILHSTSVDLGASGWDESYGYGEVNAKAAVDSIGGGSGGDTTPPAKVTGLTATHVSSTQIDLTWDANSESDLSHYNIYRDGVLIDQTTSTSYSDTGLSPATTYTYEVSAVDTSNNEGAKSDPASATTESGGTTDSMYVQAIDMWYEKVYWWIFFLGYDIYTKVTIYDNTASALSGATVYMDLSLDGSLLKSYSGDTGADGTITFIYEASSSETGTYTATVTDIKKTGYIYDSASNVEKSETLNVP